MNHPTEQDRRSQTIVVIIACLLLVAGWGLLANEEVARAFRSPNTRTLLPGEEVLRGASSDEITWAGSRRINVSNWSAQTQFPRIAANGETVHASWEARFPSGGSDTFHTYTSSPWSTWPPNPAVVSDSMDSLSQPAVITTDDDGVLHVAWQEIVSTPQGQAFYLLYRRMDSDKVWTLAQPTLASVPALATGSNDTVFVGWMNSDRDISIRWSTDGGSHWPDWAQTEVEDTAPSSFDAGLGVDESGNLHVVWMEATIPTEGKGIIRYRVGSPSGGVFNWNGSAVTASDPVTSCVRPSIAVSGTKAFIAWGRMLEKRDLFFTSCSTPLNCTDPITIGKSVVVNANEPTAAAPILALDEDGTIGAVWHGDQESEEPGTSVNEEILFTYSTDGGTTWQIPATEVSRSPGRRSIDPDLTFADGIAHIVWREKDPDTDKYNIFYTHSDMNVVFLPLVMRSYDG